MDKFTYDAGSKSSIERLNKGFRDEGWDADPVGRDLSSSFEGLWSHDEFKRHMVRAFDRYCRIVETREASRRCGLRINRAAIKRISIDLDVIANPLSGEA